MVAPLDLSAFSDWLEENAEPWPKPSSRFHLTGKQTEIVTRNTMLLLDRRAWNAKVELFELWLENIPEGPERTKERSRHKIHFDGHIFDAAQSVHDFSRYRFPCDVSFSASNFGAGDVSFLRAEFECDNVYFKQTFFGTGKLSFNHANFGHSKASFVGAIFGDETITFSNAILINGSLSFGRSVFGHGDVRFDDASLAGSRISFDGAAFGRGSIQFRPQKEPIAYLSLKDVATEGNLFVRASIQQHAYFRGLSVSGTADFSECSFARIPDFRNTSFQRPPEVSRMQVPRPKLKRFVGMYFSTPRMAKTISNSNNTYGSSKFRVSSIFLKAVNVDDVSRFRKLKSMAVAANDHEKDGYFFAREMMAKRGVETVGFWPLLLDSAYALLSDYGQSISRPIWGFAASLFAFAAFYTLPLVFLGRVGVGQAAIFAGEYSAHNFVPLLNTLFRFALSPSGFKTGFETRLDAIHRQLIMHRQAGLFDWIVTASVVQQLFGGVLLFLLLLGLRNKFRLK